MDNEKIEHVVNGYLECALWCSTDENDNELDAEFSICDFDRDGKDKALNDCQSFLKKSDGLIKGIPCSQLGHDFWLTRNGHGAGFWDRGLEHGDQLTEIAELFGECYCEKTDINKVTLFQG